MRNRWTEEALPSLEGRTALVTGGNSGIGFEAVRMLASRGAAVILASRSGRRGAAARDRILKRVPAARIEVIPLDLGSLDGIARFAERVKERCAGLDILLNNAGVMMGPCSRTADGFERQLGINHLGHFALTGRLLPLLKRTPGARVVTVSSRAHRYGEIDFSDLMWETRPYDSRRAYGQSKIANLYFAYELQRRAERAGLSLQSSAAHPGRSNTGIARSLGPGAVNFLLRRALMPLLTQPARIGALAGVRAAVDPDAPGGAFYGPVGRREKRGYPVISESNRLSRDEGIAEKLWEISEALTGVPFNFGKD